MEEITLEDLRKYRHLLQDIRAIQEELRRIYLQSPAPSEVAGGKSSVPTPGDPTARKAMQAIERKDQLEKLLQERDIQRGRIEIFVDHLDDHHVAAILRWRYLLGYSWAETCMKMYGYPNSDICRMAVQRYFLGKDNKENGIEEDYTE